MIWLIAGVVLLVVVLFIFRSGGFDKNEVKVLEAPEILSSQLTVYYKHHIGSYFNMGAQFKELTSLVPAGATFFGIYYDDPSKVKLDHLQSAIGVVVEKDGEKLIDEVLCEQLSRRGLEKMVLPGVTRSVSSTRQFSFLGAMLPIANPIAKLYNDIKEYIVEHRLETTIAIEFFHDEQISVHFPLDHAEEYIVPEKLTTEELEHKLAKKKFDSDEESSESELSGDEEEEEEEKGEEGEKKNE